MVRRDEERAPRVAPRWTRVALAVVFGLLLAADVWEAIGNLLGVTGTAAALGTSMSAVGWAVLVFAIVLPVAAFLGVLWFGRRAGLVSLVIAYATATVVVAALSLDLLAIYGIGTLLA
ncbi:hypothetical protein [Labedella endophytica]|uniref:Uncharacterized protein n=1 Tax=Labedella endophytica TaxID=1523160 RepID=A0A3S0VRC6_9MICO|nr:hypothetical protein [Labedella endophytica]RUQ97630.1 hypothetical protein ELQ94_15850 [Labedella endophytica]